MNKVVVDSKVPAGLAASITVFSEEMLKDPLVLDGVLD